MLNKNTILPDFFKSLFILSDKLTLAMLSVLLESTDEFGSIGRRKGAFAFHHIITPFTFIFIASAREKLAKAMTLAQFPVTHVQVSRIIKTGASISFSQVVFPRSMVLVVTSFFFIGAVKHTLPVSLVHTIHPKHLPLVLVTISISQLIYSVSTINIVWNTIL
jgi:hypothetical protein